MVRCGCQVILALLALGSTSVALAQPKIDLGARPTAYGLYPVLNTDMDRVFVRPDAGLPFFRSVYVAPVGVALRSQRGDDGQPMPVAIDSDRLQEVASYFRTALQSRLAATTYSVVSQPQLGALRLRTALIDISVAPGQDQPAGEPDLANAIAEMTLVIELSDATTHELLVQVADQDAVAIDLSADADRDANRDTVSRLLDGWAARVAVRLDQIKRLGGVLN